VIHAISGADLAPWDLHGKTTGKPVYELLGSGRQKSIRAYASYLFGSTTGETGALTRQAVDLGLTAMKFGWGPFGADLTQDLTHVEAARRAAGDARYVMVDAGQAFDAPAALERAERLQQFRIGWLEEPLSRDDLKGPPNCALLHQFRLQQARAR
jgi:L-alanine-DL-glutamate epimerase-like enolase superfamily enzyme